MAGEISVRLTGDSSNFRTTMEEAATAFGNTTEKLEHHLLGTRAIASAIGTSLGLHFGEIAQNVARLVLGFSEEEEKALKEIGKIGEETANVYEETYKKRRTAAEEIKQLSIEQARLYQHLNELQSDHYVSEWVENSVEVITKRKKTAEEEVDIANTLHKLSLNDRDLRVAALQVQKDQTEEVKKTAEEDAKAATALEKQTKQNTKVSEEYQNLLEKGVKENLRFLELQAKGRDRLTDSEAKEIKILEQGYNIRQNQAEIEKALKVPLDERTDKQKEHLRLLEVQKVQLAAQLGIISSIVVANTDNATAAAQVTDEYEKQLEAQRKLAAITISNKSDGRDNTQLTDAELQEKLSNLKSQVANTLASQGGNDWLKQILISTLSGQAAQAQNELTTRFQFRTNVAGFGKDVALSGVSAFEQQRFQGYITTPDATAKISGGIDQLNQRLENSGLFPAGAPVAR